MDKLYNECLEFLESFPDLKKILPKLTPEKELLEAFEVPAIFLEGLKNCFWPGRGQILLKNEISYFLDGAHTPKSIAVSLQLNKI